MRDGLVVALTDVVRCRDLTCAVIKMLRSQTMKMTTMSKRISRSAWAVIVAGALAGCASAPPPTEKISLARDAVERALSAQATQFAPLEMKTAQDKLARMEQAIGEKNYVQVSTLAEQIEADANVAEAKAQAVRKQQVLKQAQEGIQVLKQEMLNAPDATH